MHIMWIPEVCFVDAQNGMRNNTIGCGWLTDVTGSLPPCVQVAPHADQSHAVYARMYTLWGNLVTMGTDLDRVIWLCRAVRREGVANSFIFITVCRNIYVLILEGAKYQWYIPILVVKGCINHRTLNTRHTGRRHWHTPASTDKVLEIGSTSSN